MTDGRKEAYTRKVFKMMHPRRTIQLLFSLAIGILATAFAPEAEASPTLTYAITDLGKVPNGLGTYPGSVHGSDAGGGLIFASDGSAYRFNPTSSNKTSTDGLPLTLGKPSPHGGLDYSDAYDRVTEAIQNTHGLTGYVESSGLNGHPWDGTSALVIVQVGADGTPGQPMKLAWTAGATKAFVGFGGGTEFLTMSGINELNQVLYKGELNPYAQAGYKVGSPVYLYDWSSGTKVDLSALLGPAYYPDSSIPVAFDDQGRIIIQGWRRDGTGDVLLLTPTNLDAGPVSVPEPSLIAFVACVAAGVAVRRARCGARR